MLFRRLLTGLGLFIAAFGVLFLLQGLSVVRWPADSFMIGRQTWVDNGAGMVVVGLGCVLLARLLARRERQRETSAGTRR